MERVIPPRLRPGSKIRFEGKGSGTLGPFALTNEGNIVLVFTQHQVEGANGPMYLEPEMVPVTGYPNLEKSQGFDYSLRMKDVFDDLPVVLKNPIEPEIGRTIFKVGMATGVTYGKVKSVDAKPKVDMGGGRIEEMQDMIKVVGIDKLNKIFSDAGDSGAFGLTTSTLEPVGILSCGDPKKRTSYFVKLTGLQRDFSLQGFYAPLSLPSDTPPELRLAISSFLPDGLFIQKNNLKDKHVETIMEELGIQKIMSNKSGFSILYTDTILISPPINDGGYVTNKEKTRLIGLIVGSSAESTVVIGIQRVMKALGLDLITKMDKEAHFTLFRAGFWRTRCKNPDCNLIIPPSAKSCPFCNKAQKEEL